ncbi:iron-siderophore ABC transporter substrate-binding protein [Amycolatopsis nigrescens]|uniref:iron-siderophore ABC transporter substrate-binding protein n=1 Tax=Amycolatopsis nigrescens TaxID=381445 RepID=UPI000360213F|nr:iron-siderophore ABC transporter substrate-binding protein [Amycolatopsis nigrescens]
MARFPSPSIPRGRARIAAVIASLLFAGMLTACGATNEPGAPAGGNSGVTEPSAFPVTIGHKYGSTTLERAPQRVVTVGLTEQDSLLALGVVPVGVTEFVGEYPGTVGPWAKDKLGGAPLPTVLKSPEGPSFEQVAALRPDLIIGLYSALTQEQYDKLSQIAPVIAQPDEYADYGIPWQDTTRTVGKAVGRPAAADGLVQGVEAKIAQIRKDNPRFEGATALTATVYEGYFVYGSQDPRTRVLTSLGFKLPPGLDQIIGDTFGANISMERTDLLDRDALVWLVDDSAGNRATLANDRLYSGLKVAKEKREVFIENASDYGNATTFVTVLSVPYQLDRMVPQLAAAVDGNPAT